MSSTPNCQLAVLHQAHRLNDAIPSNHETRTSGSCEDDHRQQALAHWNSAPWRAWLSNHCSVCGGSALGCHAQSPVYMSSMPTTLKQAHDLVAHCTCPRPACCDFCLGSDGIVESPLTINPTKRRCTCRSEKFVGNS